MLLYYLYMKHSFLQTLELASTKKRKVFSDNKQLDGKSSTKKPMLTTDEINMEDIKLYVVPCLELLRINLVMSSLVFMITTYYIVMTDTDEHNTIRISVTDIISQSWALSLAWLTCLSQSYHYDIISYHSFSIFLDYGGIILYIFLFMMS